MMPKKKQKLDPLVDYLFEVGMLAETPRSGFHFLRSGQQSVAEHIHRVAHIGYVLATLEQDVDVAKVLKMCLFHDLAETRTSDLSWLHQQYGELDEKQALEDAVASLPFKKDILDVWEEYEERQSKESKIVKDADTLELLLRLKETADAGNTHALKWVPHAIKRLHTQTGRDLAKKIMKTRSDRWWFTSKDDEWWVNRKKK